MLAVALAALTLTAPDPLTLVAEQSRFTRTGRYDEVLRFADALRARHPSRVRVERFGETPEGRPMIAIVVGDEAKVLEPAGARAAGRLVLVAQGGIHAGEIDGKDAGLALLRDALDGRAALPLSALTVVFVPVFNVDGHERFGPNQRPNQVGPEEGGWRVTSQNLNLNRDYAKAEAPEMRAMLGLLDAWQPELYVDLHVTDGAEFQHDVAVLVDPSWGATRTSTLARVGEALQREVLGKLTRQGHLPLPFYPSFVEDDDPASGFALGTAPPRFGTGYGSARGGLSVLVETHSWKPYRERVAATRHVLIALAEGLAARAAEVRRAVGLARSTSLAGQRVTLSWEAEPTARTIEFLGYAYTRTPSPVSGGLRTRYDATKKETWKLPLRDVPRPKLVVDAPRAGYVVLPGARVTIEPTLRAHGLRLEVIAAARPRVSVRAFRAERVTLAERSVEGHVPTTVEGAWRDELQDLPAGSLFVPIDQPSARLVLWLLEPKSPDSFVAWGRLSAYFEKKEYLEGYVTEAWAEALLARDPAVRAAFLERLHDPAFASKPAARLEWFQRRHPSWDARHGLYPVYQVDAVPR